MILDLTGLDDIKEKLRNGEICLESFDARWKVQLRLRRQTPEDKDSEPTLLVYLRPIPTKKEIHELSNIWARSVQWTISFRSRSGDLPLGETGRMVLLLRRV
jgi:hypothetical protein